MTSGLSARLIEAVLTPTRIAIIIVVFTVSSFIVDFTWKPRYSSSLPRVGFGGGIVGNIRNWVGYISHFNDWVAEGYEKYTKHDRAYVVPSAPSRPQEIVVPRSQTSWLLDFPDRMVSTEEAHADLLYSSYQFLGVDGEFPGRALHKNLARNLIGLIPRLQDDVQESVDAAFGLDTDNWKTLNLWEAWLEIAPRMTNRILAGEETCKNKTFVNSQVAFADIVVRNSFILNMFPRILQPIFAPLVVASNWRVWRKSFAIIRPLLKTRLHDMERKAAGDPTYDTWEPEESLVTWMIRQAQLEGRPDRLTPKNLSQSLLPIEFAAIHTTVLTGHNLMLDLLSSNPADNYLEIIRDETRRVFAEQPDGYWSKQGLARLHRTDSAIRESLRLSHFATSLTHRKVIAKEGITNAKEGWHAPPGSYLMLDLAGTHHDPDLYPDPWRYDALRFSRPREEFEARPLAERQDPDEALRIMRLGLVTTSDTYLPFSHGRHACPGRFFVAHELKMILAYLLGNYEIKPIAERPKPMWIGQTIVPPMEVMVEVRRRKGTA